MNIIFGYILGYLTVGFLISIISSFLFSRDKNSKYIEFDFEVMAIIGLFWPFVIVFYFGAITQYKLKDLIKNPFYKKEGNDV